MVRGPPSDHLGLARSIGIVGEDDRAGSESVDELRQGGVAGDRSEAAGRPVDVPVTSFAYEAVACIKDLGITNGVSPTTYGPAQLVTREQMAAFIGRFWRAA